MVWIYRILNLFKKLIRGEWDIHWTITVVQVYLINSDGKVIILYRSPTDPVILEVSYGDQGDTQEKKEVPRGCVKKMETSIKAAARELLEETGIEWDKVTSYWILPNNEQKIRKFKFLVYHLIGVAAYIPFTQEQIPVKTNPKNHTGFAWIPKEELSSSGLDLITEEGLHQAFSAVERERGIP